MSRDAQVRACLTTKRLSVLSSRVEVRASGPGADAAHIARVVEAQLGGVEGGVAGIVTGALDALAMGYAVGELLWTPEGALSQVRWHDPRRFVFEGDAWGDVEFVTLLDAALRLPRDRFVLYAYNARYNNPYGESDLVSAYRAYASKEAIRRMWLTALDRFGAPTPVAHVPPSWSQEDCDRLAQQLSNLQTQSALVVPSDVQFSDALEYSRLEPGVGFRHAVDFENAEIARAILGQELTTGTGSGGGGASYALGKVHEDVAARWIQALRADVAARVLEGQVARAITTMQFGPQTPAPRVTFPALSDAEMDARRQLIVGLVGGGVVAPSEGWIRAYLDLPRAGDPADTTPADYAGDYTDNYGDYAGDPFDDTSDLVGTMEEI